MLGGLVGCVSYDLREPRRPPLPLPAALSDAYRLDDVIEEYLVPVDVEHRIFTGMVRAGPELAQFHLVLPRGVDRRKPVPLVLCLTILAGGRNLMHFITESMAERGFAAAWVERAGPALGDGQRGIDIEQLFRRTVQHNRMVLRWARMQTDRFAGQPSILGISTGGIIGSVVAALDQEIEGAVLCLAGAGLPKILADSAETRIRRWRQWRAAADGIGSIQLERELRRDLASDPARFGPFVDPARVFLVATTFDRVVPMAAQDLLWESLGRPKRLLLPLSHYTATLAMPRILNAAARFLKARHGLAEPNPTPAGALPCIASIAPVSSAPPFQRIQPPCTPPNLVSQ